MAELVTLGHGETLKEKSGDVLKLDISEKKLETMPRISHRPDWGTGAHSQVPATKTLVLLRPNLLPMMAKGGVVLRRHI